MSDIFRIEIRHAGDELVIENPPRRSPVLWVFFAVAAGILIWTGYKSLEDWGTAHRMPLVYALAFVAVMVFMGWMLLRDVLWRSGGCEILRVRGDLMRRDDRGFTHASRDSMEINRRILVSVVDPYPADEVGLAEVLRMRSLGGGEIRFGRELSSQEAEAVIAALRSFGRRHGFAVSRGEGAA